MKIPLEVAKTQWAIFGSLQSILITILILSIFVTGSFLGRAGQSALWQLGGAAVGVRATQIVYRWRIIARLEDR